MPKILLLEVGRPSEALVETRGAYARWFAEGLGVPVGEALDVIDVHGGEPLRSAEGYDGIVVTGSAAMVTDRADWSEASASLLRSAYDAGRAILGVCYGHQLLAHALGGEVAYNPRGRQIGTVIATLTDAGREDALLSGLGEPLSVQTSHKQVVTKLPEGAVRLAEAPLDPNHAFRIGPRAWGVQFHPEFDGPITRTFVRERREAMRGEGLDPEAVEQSVQDSEQGRAILRRFAKLALG
jgi:GMP synthase (glutamine-hydrolysing)